MNPSGDSGQKIHMLTRKLGSKQKNYSFKWPSFILSAPIINSKKTEKLKNWEIIIYNTTEKSRIL